MTLPVNIFGKLVCFLFVFSASPVFGQREMPLWSGHSPGDNGLSGTETIVNVASHCLGNISSPTLTVHLPSPEKATGAAVVVIPGGGYGVVCAGSEGKAIADILVPQGIAAIVLKYRLPNGNHKIPATDARRAIRTVRHNANSWNVDPSKVGVWGFSAGGHLASTVATVFDQDHPESDDLVQRQSSRPDFSILFYPVITMGTGVTHKGSRRNLLGPGHSEELAQRYSNETQVGKDTPPTFLLHCSDDQAVAVENSLLFYRQLLKHGIKSQLLIYETGGHGPAAFLQNPTWWKALTHWLDKRGCI